MDSEDELPSILGSCLTVLERLCNIHVDNKKFPLGDYSFIFLVEIFAKNFFWY